MPQDRAHSFPPPGHDHRSCAADAIAAAESICQDRGSRLTALRQRVLEVIWEGHRPLGAYDILARLNRDGGRIAPMAVYRALDFLIDHGLVHRLASRNAFIGCRHPGDDHSAHFLICDRCGSVAELAGDTIGKAITKNAGAMGFSVSDAVIEITGLCPNCRAS